MLKSVHILSSIFLFAIATACQKDKEMAEPTVAPPVQEANISFTYTYPAAEAENKGQTFLAKEPAGKLTTQKLTLVFEKESRAAGAGTDEHLEFVLPSSKQTPGFVGSYTIATQPDPGQGDVLATYERPFYGTGAYLNRYSGNTDAMDGSLTITEYNAERQLISGSYSFLLKNIKDPFKFLGVGSQSDSRPACEVKCYGTFKEIPLL
ncbi:hypothetical protein DNI29_02910 [Hymenobacter sediminis]|uniref:hypothetical protein n=1 Tax=Hymenobacter sediminis TaxID=2218621 RepID=UPI000DA6658A|nr:hypothetical protein [Hymenobacter sediminis]RPD49761.1 hypothetical protein DNI29_02910 [Hymenobacter sediminis]